LNLRTKTSSGFSKLLRYSSEIWQPSDLSTRREIKEDQQSWIRTGSVEEGTHRFEYRSWVERSESEGSVRPKTSVRIAKWKRDLIEVDLTAAIAPRSRARVKISVMQSDTEKGSSAR